MAYSTEVCHLLATQLDKLSGLHVHQLAGHAANIPFWLDEAKHCLSVVDGYHDRFQRLSLAQQVHIDLHHTTETRLACPGCTDCGVTEGRPAAPRLVPEKQLRAARQAIYKAMEQFLGRCYALWLIEEGVVQKACAEIGIELEVHALPDRVPRQF